MGTETEDREREGETKRVGGVVNDTFEVFMGRLRDFAMEVKIGGGSDQSDLARCLSCTKFAGY